MKRIYTIAAVIIALQCAVAYGANPIRIYHDTANLNDTTLLYQDTTNILESAALEARLTIPPNTVAKLLWDYRNEGRYCWATMKRLGTVAIDDMSGSDKISVETGRRIDGKDTIASRKIYEIAKSKEDITIMVELNYRERKADVAIGYDQLDYIGTTPLDKDCRQMMGIEITGKSDVQYIVEEYVENPTEKLRTLWNKESVKKYLTDGHRPEDIEGIWKYLDRDNDPRYGRIGGEYTLAIVKTSDGYQMVYLSGANINSDAWHEGMKKGELRSTVFSCHYDMVWYDSMLNEHSAECSATMVGDNILQLDFPLLKTTVRLSKCATDSL